MSHLKIPGWLRGLHRISRCKTLVMFRTFLKILVPWFVPSKPLPAYSRNPFVVKVFLARGSMRNRRRAGGRDALLRRWIIGSSQNPNRKDAARDQNELHAWIRDMGFSAPKVCSYGLYANASLILCNPSLVKEHTADELGQHPDLDQVQAHENRTKPGLMQQACGWDSNLSKYVFDSILKRRQDRKETLSVFRFCAK